MVIITPNSANQRDKREKREKEREREKERKRGDTNTPAKNMVKLKKLATAQPIR